MLKELVFAGLLFSIVLLAGCTQQQPVDVGPTCEDYCSGLDHVDCVGSWSISGEYPDCVCEWVCVAGGSDVITGCTPNWTCTDWSGCVDGVQTRTCTDVNECNTTTDKPDESRSCELENPCDDVSDSDIKSECNVIFLEDASYCEDDPYSDCVYDLAKLTLNESLCEEINNSFKRNTCHAIVSNDRTNCGVIQPSLRNLCRTTFDVYLSSRAVVEEDSYYCGLIETETVKDSCESNVEKVQYYNYTNNHTICERFSFTYNISDYQEIYSCYAYHAKNSDDTPCEGIKNVVNLSDKMYDECLALRNDDISYCYDFNSSRRDRCFAHFAYLRDDPLVCRDADNRDECLNIVGKYFSKIDYCKRISSKSLRNSCIHSVSTKCLVYDWRGCNVSSCTLIDDNNALKDACIFNIIEYNQEHSFIYKRLV
ncbi:hypothetical protein GF352_01155 [archaeon]|nr:hypothetical protein [archaeon]